MSKRCIELLSLNKDNKPKCILDVGCGTGISGHCLNMMNKDDN